MSTHIIDWSNKLLRKHSKPFHSLCNDSQALFFVSVLLLSLSCCVCASLFLVALSLYFLLYCVV